MKKRTWLALALLAYTLSGVCTWWYYYVFWPPRWEKYRAEGILVDPAPWPAFLGAVLFVTLAISYRWVKKRDK